MKTLISTLLAVFILVSCTQEQKPNIIVLLVDDAGYADFGFAGSQDLETPNIDALAADGVIFSDAHVSATVCGPSRAGLMTGRYQQRFGFECNPDENDGIDLQEKTIGEAMKSAGYTTAAFGKWHLGSDTGYKPNDRGFDYFWGFLSGSRPYFNTPSVDKAGHSHSIRQNDEHTTFEGYLTDALADEAVSFIDRNKDKPFFIYWSPNAVHTPMQATEEDLARYESHPRQQLAAMTWALDRAVGKITTKLKEAKIYDNTLIFFLSDNGGAHNNQSSNLPLKGFKGNKYEGGHRVAFFATYPKAFEAGTFDGLSSSLDIFATSINLAGVPNFNPERPSDGVNLMPYLQGEKTKNPHSELFWRKDKEAAARVGNYKMIRVKDLGYRFYNLKDNLSEDVDLQYTQKEELEEVQQKMEQWESELMAPLWTEGAMWDTITYLIHEDYYNNTFPKVRNPEELKILREKQKH